MCRSKAEGGQRCAQHALERANKTGAAVRDDDGTDPARTAKLQANHRAALVEYASTTQGQVVLMTVVEDARRTGRRAPVGHDVEDLPQVVFEGYRLRKENAAVKQGIPREATAGLDYHELERLVAGKYADVDVPSQSRVARERVNPEDATYESAPLSHFAKAARSAAKLTGDGHTGHTPKENDPAFMRTPHGDECAPRPRNVFHDTTRLDHLEREYSRKRDEVVGARGRSDPEAAGNALDRLRIDYQEQQFVFEQGHYPKYPFPASTPS